MTQIQSTAFSNLIFCERNRVHGSRSAVPRGCVTFTQTRRLNTSASNCQLCSNRPGGHFILRTTLQGLTTAVMTLPSFFIFSCSKPKTLIANGKWVSFKDEQQEMSTAMITWKVTFCFGVKDSFSAMLIKSSTLKNKHTPLLVALGMYKTIFTPPGLCRYYVFYT